MFDHCFTPCTHARTGTHSDLCQVRQFGIKHVAQECKHVGTTSVQTNEPWILEPSALTIRPPCFLGLFASVHTTGYAFSGALHVISSAIIGIILLVMTNFWPYGLIKRLKEKPTPLAGHFSSAIF
jgi:hypothetical protein